MLLKSSKHHSLQYRKLRWLKNCRWCRRTTVHGKLFQLCDHCDQLLLLNGELVCSPRRCLRRTTMASLRLPEDENKPLDTLLVGHASNTRVHPGTHLRRKNFGRFGSAIYSSWMQTKLLLLRMEFSTLRAWLTLSFSIYDLKFENTISWSTTYQSTLDWSAALPPLSFLLFVHQFWLCSSVKAFFLLIKTFKIRPRTLLVNIPLKNKVYLYVVCYSVLKNSG